MAMQLQSSFTGTVGNLTFYKLYNQYYVRTKSPGGVQTEATKACQQPFGMAATVAANLRRILLPAIPNPTSKEAQNRFSNAVLQWLRSDAYQACQFPCQVQELQGFQFVPQTTLQQLLHINISVYISLGKELTIHLPAFTPKQDCKAPQGTKTIQLEIASGSYHLGQKKITSVFHQTVEIPYISKRRKEEIITTLVTIEPNQVIATAVSIGYNSKQPGSPVPIPVRQHRWRAASVISIACT